MAGLEIITFGCRLNAFESEVIRGAAGAAGPARRGHRQHLRGDRRGRAPGAAGDPPRPPRASERAHHRHRLRRDPDRRSAMPRSPRSIWSSTTRRSCGPRAMRDGPSPPPSPRLRRDGVRATRSPLGARGRGSRRRVRAGRARAYLQVQQGCDHRCTFCIIPYARGPSRSVPLGAIVEQARALVAAGYREIVLTGVDLTAYGADLPDRPSLGQMVAAAARGGARAAAPAAVLARPERDRRRISGG